MIEWPEGRRANCVNAIAAMLNALLEDDVTPAVQTGLWSPPMTLPIEKDLAEQLVQVVERMATEEPVR